MPYLTPAPRSTNRTIFRGAEIVIYTDRKWILKYIFYLRFHHSLQGFNFDPENGEFLLPERQKVLQFPVLGCLFKYRC